MIPNLRAVVAKLYRSIGARNISSSTARRKSRSTNGSVMGATNGRRFVDGNLVTGQSHKTTSLPGSLAFWTVAGYGFYGLSGTFRVFIPTRQRQEEKELLAERREQLLARWEKLSKEVSEAN